jgi:hypothetical protein
LKVNFRHYEEWLKPAEDSEFDRQIKGLFTSGASLGRISRLDDKAREAAAKVYQKTLSNLPLDLLKVGIKEAVTRWVYPGLPAPSEILDPVRDELAKRTNEAAKISAALRQMKDPEASPAPKRVTPDQIAALRKKYPEAFGLLPEMPLHPEERMSQTTKERIRGE